MDKNIVISLTEINGKNIKSFQNQILEVIYQNPKLLVVDMKSVALIDSLGLRAILSILKKMRENGGELILCHVQPAVMTILELTEMDKVFKISYSA